MGPTHATGNDRAVARGRCRRRLKARPAVAQPEGHAAHNGADRARGSGLSFVDRSERHQHRGRAEDDAHRSEEHTSALQSLMHTTYYLFQTHLYLHYVLPVTAGYVGLMGPQASGDGTDPRSGR